MQLSKEIFIKLKESVAFFNTFSAGELIALLKLAKTETFNDGEVIFKENTRGDKMYIILVGTVKISRYMGKKKEEEVLVNLKPGACFGEMGIIDQSPRSASATAVEGSVTALSIKESLLSQNNILLAYKLYRNFSVMLAGRLRETNDKLQAATEGDRASSSQVKTLLKKKVESGQSMEGVNLKNADLSGAFLNNTNFENSILIGSNLSGVRCKETIFKGSDFTNAVLNSNTFEQATFEGANFTAASFNDAVFQSCNFTNAKFRGAELNESQIKNLPDDAIETP